MISLIVAIALAWDIPIERVDGSELKPESIVEYAIYHYEERYTTSELTINIPTEAGEQCFNIATVAEEEGPKSAELCINVPPALPHEPINITINIVID